MLYNRKRTKSSKIQGGLLPRKHLPNFVDNTNNSKQKTLSIQHNTANVLHDRNGKPKAINKRM